MNDGIRKGQDIAERVLAVGVRVIEVVRALPRDPASKHIGGQLIRAATSIGANYEEARAAESRADFAHKTGISRKEARETIYWLRLVDRAGLTKRPLQDLIDEVQQLAAILVASRRTARTPKT